MIWAVPKHQEGAVIARNLRSAMSAYSRSSEQGTALDLGAAGAFSSGIDFAVFNALVLSAPVSLAGLIQLLDQGEAFYLARGVAWSCWLDETMAGGGKAARLLESRGMRWVAEHDGMLSVRIEPDRRKLPAVFARLVTDEETREDFVRVCSHVFLLPEEITRRVYGSPSFWQGVMRGWVGYDDGGRPVCIAVSAADECSVGLYSVGTMPGYRRRGYGEAITRHALGEAAVRSGLNQWSLQSTPAGLKLYRRMGYRAHTRISVWSSQ